MRPVIQDFDTRVGSLHCGPMNRITDVPGVTVGHHTIDNHRCKTGVTVIMPCPENPFFHKLPAASFVLNGYGKTLGLVQVNELGTLETPLALTNTLNVGRVHDAMVEYMIRRCAQEGHPNLRSVNPVVCECCDASLNDIQARSVGAEHVFAAIEAADCAFEEGDVGAGKGMICHGLKGGIGSASRVMSVDGAEYTLGVLVLTNHGRLADFAPNREPVGTVLAEKLKEYAPDKGSCIVIAATDLPLDSRQLGRVLRRASVGLARLGSYIGEGSGEVFIGFSTANAVDPREERAIRTGRLFADSQLDLPFRAIAECTEEAVLKSMLAAHTVTGYTGRTVYSLKDLKERI